MKNQNNDKNSLASPVDATANSDYLDHLDDAKMCEYYIEERELSERNPDSCWKYARPNSRNFFDARIKYVPE